MFKSISNFLWPHSSVSDEEPDLPPQMERIGSDLKGRGKRKSGVTTDKNAKRNKKVHDLYETTLSGADIPLEFPYGRLQGWSTGRAVHSPECAMARCVPNLHRSKAECLFKDLRGIVFVLVLIPFRMVMKVPEFRS